jgi:hypothetical protein
MPKQNRINKSDMDEDINMSDRLDAIDAIVEDGDTGNTKKSHLMLWFKIEDLDISNPTIVKEFKEHILRVSYDSALSGRKDASAVTASLKNVLEICCEAEKHFNVVRAERLTDMEMMMDKLEIEMDRILAENIELKSKLSKYEDA